MRLASTKNAFKTKSHLRPLPPGLFSNSKKPFPRHPSRLALNTSRGSKAKKTSVPGEDFIRTLHQKTRYRQIPFLVFLLAETITISSTITSVLFVSLNLDGLRHRNTLMPTVLWLACALLAVLFPVASLTLTWRWVKAKKPKIGVTRLNPLEADMAYQLSKGYLRLRNQGRSPEISPLHDFRMKMADLSTILNPKDQLNLFLRSPEAQNFLASFARQDKKKKSARS